MSISVLCSPASSAAGSDVQRGASWLPGHFSASSLHSLFKPPLTPQVERKARGSTGKWYRMLQHHIGGLWGWHCGSIETSPCRKLPLSHSPMQAVPMASPASILSATTFRERPHSESPQKYVPGQVPREQITPGRFSHCPCATVTLVLPLAKRQMPAPVRLPSESSSSSPGLDTPSALGSVFRPFSLSSLA